MEWQAKLIKIEHDFNTNKVLITFVAEYNGHAVANYLNAIKDKVLLITSKPFRPKRSLNANGLLWVCCDKIASKINTDKDSVYEKMIKRYGVFQPISIKNEAVNEMISRWKIYTIVSSGPKYTDMHLYFGSSVYNTKEFSRLLDGTISEMRELGIETPASKELENAIERWKKESIY